MSHPRRVFKPHKSGSGVSPLCFRSEEAGRLFHFYVLPRAFSKVTSPPTILSR